MDLSQFLGADGVRIRFSRVAEVGVGAVFGAILTGMASVVLALFDIPIALLGGLADFLGAVVNILAGLPAVIVEQGFTAAVPFVLDAGPAGFVAALAVVLPGFYLSSWVVSRVRE